MAGEPGGGSELARRLRLEQEQRLREQDELVARRAARRRGRRRPEPVTEALQSDGSTPVAYDPCRPIHYVVNRHGGPADGNQLIAAAVARVSAATGLSFVFDGASDEVWSDRRESYQPTRYPDRWAPVLISWSSPADAPRLTGDVAGFGGSTRLSFPGGWVYVTGEIVLDSPQLIELDARPSGPQIVQSLIEHELGHVVGLAHVDDTTQLMNPVGSDGVTDYRSGDLEGLALLGQGRCFPEA